MEVRENPMSVVYCKHSTWIERAQTFDFNEISKYKSLVKRDINTMETIRQV
jgi:hypothetical protein